MSSRLSWLRQFRVDRTERALLLNTPWGWLECVWFNAAEERAFVEQCNAELMQPCIIERMTKTPEELEARERELAERFGE